MGFDLRHRKLSRRAHAHQTNLVSLLALRILHAGYLSGSDTFAQLWLLDGRSHYTTV